MAEITLTKQDIENLRAWLNERDVDADSLEFRHNYSGRGMYGRTCFGVVGSSSRIAAAQIALYTLMAQDISEEDALGVIMNSSRDSMGYDSIVYWTEIVSEGDDEDDDEDY